MLSYLGWTKRVAYPITCRKNPHKNQVVTIVLNKIAKSHEFVGFDMISISSLWINDGAKPYSL